MTTRTASCSCGKLNVTVEGDPIRVSMCHCLACQKRTGSAFGIQARFPRDKVHPSGPAQEFIRVGDAGHTIRFRFCPTCGSTVYYTFDDLPDAIAVTVGAFADPTFPPPRVSVYGVRRHPWVSEPENIERLDG